MVYYFGSITQEGLYFQKWAKAYNISLEYMSNWRWKEIFVAFRKFNYVLL